jgi:transposase
MHKQTITRLGRLTAATFIATVLAISAFSTGASATTIGAGITVESTVIVNADQPEQCCGTWP